MKPHIRKQRGEWEGSSTLLARYPHTWRAKSPKEAYALWGHWQRTVVLSAIAAAKTPRPTPDKRRWSFLPWSTP